jgi:hypothetical protein
VNLFLIDCTTSNIVGLCVGSFVSNEVIKLIICGEYIPLIGFGSCSMT